MPRPTRTCEVNSSGVIRRVPHSKVSPSPSASICDSAKKSSPPTEKKCSPETSPMLPGRSMSAPSSTSMNRVCSGRDDEVALIGRGRAVVVDGDAGAVRIVEPEAGRSFLFGNGRVVLVRPGVARRQRVPAHLVARVDVAGDEVGLHRLVADDGVALVDAHDDGLAPVQRYGRAVRTVDGHRRVVAAGHDVDGGVLEGVGVVGVRRVLADRYRVFGRPRIRVQDLDGAGEERTGVLGIGTGRHRDRERGLDAVAAVEEDVVGIAGNRNQIDEIDDVAAREQVVDRDRAQRRWEIPVAPDFGRRLRRRGDVDLVAVFPVVVVDDRAGCGDRDADRALHRTADVVGDRAEAVEEILLRQRHEECLDRFHSHLCISVSAAWLGQDRGLRVTIEVLG